MNAQNHAPPEAWESVLPVLDEAMLGLSEVDRQALIIRFFDGCSFQEAAERLGSTEEASRKRVKRALDKLTGLLRRRGVAIPAAALTTALSAQSAQAVPAGAASAIAESAWASAPSLSATTVFTHTLTAMTLTKFTIAAAAIAFALPVAVGWQRVSTQSSGARRLESSDAAPMAAPARPEIPRPIPETRDPRLAEIASRIARLGPYERDAENWLEVASAIMALPGELLAEAWNLLKAHGSDRGPLVQALFARWGEVDPQRSADEAAATGDSSLQTQAWLGLLSTWVLRDPKSALERVQQLPEGLMREATTLSALEKLALARPDEALALAATLPEARVAEYSKATTLALWAERDPEAAVAWIDANEPEDSRHLVRKKLYDNLTIERPDLVLTLTLKEAEPSIRHDATLFAIQQIALPGPERALEALRSLPADLRTRDMAGNIGMLLARLAPESLRGVIAAEPAGEFRDGLARNWINAQGESQPDVAAGMAAGFQTPHDRAVMLEFTTKRWMERDRAAAEAWVRDTPLLDDATKQKLLNP
jgi:hypothetical protein